MVVGGKVCYINWRSSARPHSRNCYMCPSPVYGDCEGDQAPCNICAVCSCTNQSVVLRQGNQLIRSYWDNGVVVFTAVGAVSTALTAMVLLRYCRLHVMPPSRRR